ncbi:hypothetical protein AAFF_G00178510 [Aldrovandia affinis]|uniref:Uncharacterized protein n=1 Tax=Aldrovandia affinis TaxID=143900 RepID=A0AAD7RL27_9TELE|nr:hypothetical protein AAFF_G00178510 [Aldrovandia affinis]
MGRFHKASRRSDAVLHSSFRRAHDCALKTRSGKGQVPLGADWTLMNLPRAGTVVGCQFCRVPCITGATWPVHKAIGDRGSSSGLGEGGKKDAAATFVFGEKSQEARPHLQSPHAHTPVPPTDLRQLRSGKDAGAPLSHSICPERHSTARSDPARSRTRRGRERIAGDNRAMVHFTALHARWQILTDLAQLVMGTCVMGKVGGECPNPVG